MPFWYTLSLFIHILCGAFWIGGMLFLPVVLLPSIRDHPERKELLYRTGIRFRLFGWIALGLLLVSGLANMYAKGLPFSLDFLFSDPLGKLLGYKLVLFGVILLISGVHDFYLGEKAIGEEGDNNERLRSISHTFGLSDLHQLRGRVGRSNKKAYCYLLTPPVHTLTDEARKRLKAIEQFSDLGSGFNIAMRDLDIRGAGDLLGAEQSGFINEIGYEMYQKVLNEAIAELKQNEFKDLFV